MNQMQIGNSRATAIAAVNALVVHLQLGHFVSVYEWIAASALRYPDNASAVAITCGTNTGVLIYAECTVIEEKDSSKNFPIEAVFVLVKTNRISPQYFECSIGVNGIQITKLAEFPF